MKKLTKLIKLTILIKLNKYKIKLKLKIIEIKKIKKY
jgi:hypothetical protein